MNDKLKDIPHIFLLTLDERSDRLKYTETQYDYWGIKDYTVVSGSKYQSSTYEDWKDLVILNSFDGYNRHLTDVSIALSYLFIIKKWLETTD